MAWISPEDSFDYDRFVKREFEGKAPALRGLHRLWWLAAVLVLAAFILAWLKR
jgi:hypothetical protein